MVGDISLLPGHVLLVEDNEVNALVVQAMLSRSGCEVRHVTNGEEAVRLATLGGRRPDVVLMDCQMPVLDGMEATRRIRALEQRLGLPRIPIVALTANTGADDRLACERAGMDQFVGKPFTEKELLAAIGAYAQREPA
jgi:CheY-like chemotaxis protein